jgi:outer membrane autotransporter protein
MLGAREMERGSRIVGFESHSLRHLGDFHAKLRSSTIRFFSNVGCTSGRKDRSAYEHRSVRAGPIAGLSYINAQIAGYTETGDILLTNIVNRQTVENLTGSAGAQLRAPFVVGNGLYSPFVNVTAEHDFIGSGRTLITTQVTTPLLPVLIAIDSRGQTYGKVAVGVAAVITDKVSASINAVGTFARAGGSDYGVSGGVKVTF